jgi:N-methylhydantoinase A/oxoprolinase/acetone carboxylase beta subunit
VLTSLPQAVLIQDNQVLAWHKTPSTTDIQTSVEEAISEVISRSNVDTTELGSVKIGTTVGAAITTVQLSVQINVSSNS